MPVLQFKERYAAPPEKVFAFFAEHSNLSKLFGGSITRVKNAPEGDDPNGLGSVRQLVIMPGLPFEETVTVYVPQERIEYKVTKGSPIKNHLGVMLFKAGDGETSLDYRIEFDPRIPGTGGLIAKILGGSIRKGLSSLHAIL